VSIRKASHSLAMSAVSDPIPAETDRFHGRESGRHCPDSTDPWPKCIRARSLQNRNHTGSKCTSGVRSSFFWQSGWCGHHSCQWSQAVRVAPLAFVLQNNVPVSWLSGHVVREEKNRLGLCGFQVGLILECLPSGSATWRKKGIFA
jgi:hypothetical protein